MPTLLYTHPACIEHDPGPHHPECPDRLRAVLHALEGEAFQHLQRCLAPPATRHQIERVHTAAHYDAVHAAIPDSGYGRLDADTIVSPGSWQAALRAAGAVCEAVDEVVAGRARNAFCAVRPPGHHAEPDRAMGFCLFNSIAIGAEQARAAHDLERVAVVDFDVHHGNGTQAMFAGDADLFYASVHQWPLYPGTGSPDDTGVAGNVLNAAVPPYAGSAEFREALDRLIVPAVRRFEPELLLISAGFDAHAADPLAQLTLGTDDYRWATRRLVAVADEVCDGRIVSTLEGGYDLAALAASAAAHVAVLLGD